MQATIAWETKIPRFIYARLYCNWRRVKREVKILKRIFSKFNVKKLIEFGCGLGRHGYLLSKMGFNVLLTDVKDWRYGKARKLPFRELDILNNEFDAQGDFDGGYAVNFLTIFEYNNMIKALKNIRKIIGNKGIFVADYNFTVYNEPRVVYIRIGEKVYKAVLEKERITSVSNGVLYEYRIVVTDHRGRVVGVEEGSYPVYRREVVFKAIEEAGFKIVDIVWASWDPINYMYRPARGESDSAFIVMTSIT